MKMTWFGGVEAHCRPLTCWTTTAMQNGGRSFLHQRAFTGGARVSITQEKNETVVSTIIGDTRPARIIGFTSLVIQEMNQERWWTIRVIRDQFNYHMTCHVYRTTLPKRELGKYRAFADFLEVCSAKVHRERVGSWQSAYPEA